jgi:predicted nuclease of restriction endonuclease-like (RecB) superfamily
VLVAATLNPGPVPWNASRMTRASRRKTAAPSTPDVEAYRNVSTAVAALLEAARRQAARAVNAILTATYWEVGRQIVEFEQQGERRAGYGEALLKRLAQDLRARFGRGFGEVNLSQMRRFFLAWPPPQMLQTLSEKSEGAPGAHLFQAWSDASSPAQRSLERTEEAIRAYLATLAQAFPLSWSHYVRLLSIPGPEARRFYETEALRGGWSVRQLDRQIATAFYERTALSKNKAAMLSHRARPEEAVTAEEEIKNPFVLEFLGLRDEYSERDLEAALVEHLQHFLLEMGNGFAFVARQKRLRVGDVWYRVDLLLYHRRLRCLILIDLKVGRFTPADAGQMNLYVNYAAEHLTLPEENPPVGLVLCSEHDAAVAHYALGGLPNKILAAEYRLTLPDAKQLEAEIEKTRRFLESPERRKGQS